MSRRAERVGDLIRDEVADILRKEIDDPRLKSGALVSITDVEVTDDLRFAKIFATILGSEKESKEAFAALRHAEPFLRRELGPRLRLRFLPEIQFHLDESIKVGARVDELLNQVKSEKKP